MLSVKRKGRIKTQHASRCGRKFFPSFRLAISLLVHLRPQNRKKLEELSGSAAP